MKTKKINLLNVIKLIVMTLVLGACCASCTPRVATNDTFPIVYQIGNDEFEVLPDFVPERRWQIWGYEITPGVIIAKKRGRVDGLSDVNWYNVKHFSEKVTINGKEGRLPSKSELKGLWSRALKERIDGMDQFLVNQGVAAEQRNMGICWSSDEENSRRARYVGLSDNYSASLKKWTAHGSVRVAIAY